MKKFWKILGVIFDWILIIFFAVILFGGGAWVIKNIFF
jgi:signal peptidase I